MIKLRRATLLLALVWPAGCIGESPQVCRQGVSRAMFPTLYGLVTADYAADDEYAFIGGDIAFRLDDLAYLSAGLSNSTPWQNGEMYFQIDPDHPQKTYWEEAVADWNARTAETGFRVLPRTNQADYVQVTFNQPGCFSALGRRGGRQVLNLNANCPHVAAAHEIGHAAGLMHEHQRRDRPLIVVLENAPPDRRSAYTIIDGITDLTEFDIESLMHYPARDRTAAPNSEPVMRPIDPTIPLEKVGAKLNDRGAQAIRPSDVRGLSKIYNGPGPSGGGPPMPSVPGTPSPTPSPQVTSPPTPSAPPNTCGTL